MAAEALTFKPEDFEYHGHATAVPVEDLKPGMTIHPQQVISPHPSYVAELAALGLTYKAIGSHFGMLNADRVRFNYGNTIAKARAQTARHLMEKIIEKATDGDMAALKLLIQRLDPEPDETTVTVNHVTQLPEEVARLTPDELNARLVSTH